MAKTTVSFKSVQESLVQSDKGRMALQHAREGIAKDLIALKVQRETMFSVETLSKLPAWPNKEMSLSQMRKVGGYEDNSLYRAVNAFSTWFYSWTKGSAKDEKSGNIILLKERAKIEKSATAGKPGKKKISGKVAELSLDNILAELQAALDREKDVDKLEDALDNLHLLVSTLTLRFKQGKKVNPVAKIAKGKK